MELLQLKYFQAVARLGNMTRAAEELYVSQPSLSRSIARLEQEMGAPLFDRNGRRLRLNDYGQILLRHIDFAFEDLEQARREIADLVQPGQGIVTLCALQGGAYLLPSLLTSFQRVHPGIRIQLFQEGQDTTFSILRGVEEGVFDLCLCPPPPDEPLLIKWQTILTDDLFLAVPPSHRLASRGSVRLAEAASESFICLPAGTAFRAITDALCQQAEFNPNIVMEVEEFTTAWEMVAARGGIAFMPGLLWQKSCATEYTPKRVSIEGEAHHWITGIAWSEIRYLSSATCLFRDFALAFFPHDD